MGGCMSCMDDDEYTLLDYPNGKEIRHGPGITCFCFATGHKKKNPRLNNDQYIEVTRLVPNNAGSLMEVVPGPCLYKVTDPYAKISDLKSKVRLGIDDYIIVKDLNGALTIVEGPTLYSPQPYDMWGNVGKKIKLTATQYVVVTNEVDGSRKVLTGPLLYTPQPLEKWSNVCDMSVLNSTDYIYVTHTDSGTIDIAEGPMKFTPGPYDLVSDIHRKIILKNNEYVKIVDNNTGVIRVVTGPSTIVPKQFEKVIEGVKTAHEINDLEAVYLFDTTTGSYELITKHGMFVPTPVQNVIEVRKKIRLELNEAMVIIDKTGKYVIMRGNDNTSAFFLPPYCNILHQEWSNCPDKYAVGNLPKISRFDMRPQYMDFEFLIRTKDNVEIFLKLNFYWQIIDIQKMITNTHNCPYDICIHAQSEILSTTSRVDMDKFMESFNEVIHNAINDDDDFYDVRGVKLIRVEITGRRCKDPDTEKNFQEIIKKKTDRIKNLEQQHGQNEVKLAEIQGHIAQEKLNGDLVSVKNEYLNRESSKAGESEGVKISNFFEHLPHDLNAEQKMRIYLDVQNTKRVNDLTHTPGLTLYVTPEQLDMKWVNLNYPDNNKQVGNRPLVLDLGRS